MRNLVRAPRYRATLHLTGKPHKHAFIVRLNGSYHEGVFNPYVFTDLDDVRGISRQWLRTYNEELHSTSRRKARHQRWTVSGTLRMGLTLSTSARSGNLPNL